LELLKQGADFGYRQAQGSGKFDVGGRFIDDHQDRLEGSTRPAGQGLQICAGSV
jgi:hypothetical protein